MFLNCNKNPNINPVNKVKIIDILFKRDIMNNWSGDKIQVNHDPEVIANSLNLMIGINDSIVAWLDVKELDLILDLLDNKDIRIEYDAVIPIDKIIRSNNSVLIFDLNIFSIIISFEKNPDMKGIPIRAILLIPKIVRVKG